MNRKFLAALTGYTNRYKMYPELNSYEQSPYTDDKVSTVRKLLGTEDEFWAVKVASIVESQNVVGLNEIKIADDVILSDDTFFTQVPDFLVSDMRGPAAILPSSLSVEAPPGSREATLVYDSVNKSVTVYFKDNTWVLPTVYKHDKVHLTWPKELGIRGALGIPDEDTTKVIELNVRYPEKEVIAELSVNEETYQLLSDTGSVHTFFYADTDAEKVSIAAYALYNYIQKKQ